MSSAQQIANGLLEVADALDDGTELVRGVLDVLSRSISAAAPVRTGALRDSIHGEMRGSRHGAIVSPLLYSSIVDKRQGYVDRGVERARSDINRELSEAGDALLDRVGH